MLDQHGVVDPSTKVRLIFRGFVCFFLGALPSFAGSLEDSSGCKKFLLQQEDLPSLDLPFSEWSDHQLIAQTQKNLEYLNARPYSYPLVDSKVDGFILIRGLPERELNLRVRRLPPNEAQGKVFRFFTTRAGLREIHRTGRISAPGHAYRQRPYHYHDLSGILLNPPSVDLHAVDYWNTGNRFWVDVTLDPRIAILEIDKNSYLVPGVGPRPQWMIDAIRKQSGVSPDELERAARMGWDATQIPVLRIIDSSDNPARAAALRSKVAVAPRFADQPLFEMFYALKGEEHYPVGRNVHYLSESERQKYKVSCNAEGQLMGIDGVPLGGSDGSRVIGVLNTDGELYMSARSRTARGLIQHSSFNGGRPVLAAFSFDMKSGLILHATNESGHYLTTSESLLLVLDLLRELDCDVAGAQRTWVF